MSSKFLLSIVDREKCQIVYFEPGLSAEIDFVDECVKNIVKRGVGVGCSTAHVTQDIRNGIEQTILDLKMQVKP